MHNINFPGAGTVQYKIKNAQINKHLSGGNAVSMQKLAEFIVQSSYEQIPIEVIEISKNIILDTIGITLAGSREETSKTLCSALSEFGGQTISSVIGGGFRTSPILASLANGTSAHVLDYDDLFASLHPSAVIVPTILAMGEKCNSSGKEILAAYAVGFEIVAKVGTVLGNRHYTKGWHSTSTLGSLSATAAAAKLLKLDVHQTKMAFGIAASLTSGLRANFGTMTKPLHAGNAARNGILAAALAKKDFTASENILGDEFGFFDVFGEEPSYDTDTMCRQLGSPFSLLSPGVWLKKYPCAAGNHASIDAVLQIRKDHSFDYDKILEIECLTGKQTPKVLIHHRPQNGLQAKFSLEYCVAAALLDGNVTLEHFTNEKVLSPELQNLISKVKYSFPLELDNTTGPYDLPRTVNIKLANGETFSSSVDNAKGQPGNPMSKEELRLKFKMCAQGVLTKAATTDVIEKVSKLEQMTEIGDLMNLLAGTR
jgi:2-methylcitrate dehydratase PrpD